MDDVQLARRGCEYTDETDHGCRARRGRAKCDNGQYVKGYRIVRLEQETAFLSSIRPLCGVPRNFVFTPESEDFNCPDGLCSGSVTTTLATISARPRLLANAQPLPKKCWLVARTFKVETAAWIYAHIRVAVMQRARCGVARPASPAPWRRYARLSGSRYRPARG